MNELKDKWTKVMPSLTLPIENPEPTPLYFYQVGNVVFIRTNGLDYSIEVYKPCQVVKVKAK